MLSSPEEIRQAVTGELYRYRLAVKEQLDRVAAAQRDVREERDRIEEDEYELLFAPSMTLEAFNHQLRAIHHRDMPLVWRLKTEVEFLLQAVCGVLSMSKALRRSTVGEENACVQRAIAAVDEAAPNAGLLRHIHVHLDAYLRGEGEDADQLSDPTQSGAVAMLDEGPVYWVGGELFVISEIAASAEELARAVAACRPAPSASE